MSWPIGPFGNAARSLAGRREADPPALCAWGIGGLRSTPARAREVAALHMTDPSLPPDSELIEGIRSGDSSILELLMATYWSALVHYAGRILDGTSDPQDVVQEAFIRLWSRRERWGPEGSVRSLLYTVTRNAALDERRRQARGERAALAADPPSPPSLPSADATAGQLRQAAVEAVSRLPPKRQEVFRLAREEGLSYADIAAVMEISPQTVANQMSLALSDLRRVLAPHLDAPP